MCIEIKIETISEKVKLEIIKCHDKQLVGQSRCENSCFRPPEPYKGKGVKFVGELREKQVNQLKKLVMALTKNEKTRLKQNRRLFSGTETRLAVF
jgi:hypothetical protein